jgi:hypothetical protein
MRRILLIAVLAMSPAWLSAARLTLRDGTVVTGRMISASTASLVFQDDAGRQMTYDLDQISMIDFHPANAPSPAYDQDRSYNQRTKEQERYDQNTANRGDERPRGVWATLQPGTEISVRSDEEINSRMTSEGRTYRASIERDIADDRGNVLIPRGSDASLIIRRAGDGQFLLDLDSVRVGGRNYAVSSTDVQEGTQGIGRNKRTGEMVGGGAVLGTLLGAIAGGGKGAAIGAGAGAVAGGGVEVLTKGKEVRVPAETVLRFRLEQPLHLREM